MTSAPVLVCSTISSSVRRALPPVSTLEARRIEAPLPIVSLRSPVPEASSWRITRSGRNSSRCIRRIERRRSTSAWL